MTRQQVNGVCAVICCALIAVSLYWQYIVELAPCPLCFIQRWIVVILALWFGLGIAFADRVVVVVNQCLISLTALLGVVVAGHHSWLQISTSGQPTACLPNLDYMLKFLPLSETFRLLFSHAGGCGQVDWDFLFLTMPMWLFIFFLGFFLVGLWGLRRTSTDYRFGLFIK
ncbi:MAG: disulfide bond formation protein B [Legionellales bacterium]|nr:disulfide bond formation protein B [Legionellales bacterium]